MRYYEIALFALNIPTSQRIALIILTFENSVFLLLYLNAAWLVANLYRPWSEAFFDVYTIIDTRYLEFQETLWNTSRYPYFDIQDLQNWGKIIEQPHFTNEYVIWLLKLEIYLKYFGKEKKLLSFPHYFITCCNISMLKTVTKYSFRYKWSFEKSEEITRVDCICSSLCVRNHRIYFQYSDTSTLFYTWHRPLIIWFGYLCCV